MLNTPLRNFYLLPPLIAAVFISFMALSTQEDPLMKLSHDFEHEVNVMHATWISRGKPTTIANHYKNFQMATSGWPGAELSSAHKETRLAACRTLFNHLFSEKGFVAVSTYDAKNGINQYCVDSTEQYTCDFYNPRDPRRAIHYDAKKGTVYLQRIKLKSGP